MNKKQAMFLVIAALVFIAAIVIVFTTLSKPAAKVIASSPKLKLIVDYDIYADGRIYESRKNFSFFEGEFSFSLGLLSKKVDDVIKNMNIGEEIDISLSVEEAFGIYKDSLRKVVERAMKMERIQNQRLVGEISTDAFRKAFGEPEINKTYYSPLLSFPIKVVDIVDINNAVKIKLDVKVGDKTEKDNFGFWNEVIAVDEKNNIISLKSHGNNNTEIPSEQGSINIFFDENYIYGKLTPKIGSVITWNNEEGKVANYNDTHIVLDDNHPLAGKSIVVHIKLLNRLLEKSENTSYSCGRNDGPEFDVFIMSYCPYGLQFIKGLLPVWKEFNDKANINVRFVSYIMHGQKEADENARMICIREEQCEKYIQYLECFVTEGNVENCIEKAGIDKSKVDTCIANRAKDYLAKDAELNKKYGITGSPVVVINSQEVDVWPRSPANIAKTLCQYFTEKPSECDLEFNNQNPNPGFGFGYSTSSTSPASCG